MRVFLPGAWLALSSLLLLFRYCLGADDLPSQAAFPGRDQWSQQQAWDWYNSTGGWLVGANFNPSTSINQLEFFQKEDYDTEVF
jgi:hypothetical protein